MNKVTDTENYNSILKEFKSNHKKCVSNNYWMFNDIEKFISESRLYYIFSDTGLVFLCDEGSHYKTVFTAVSDYTGEKIIIETDKPCISEIVSVSKELNARNASLKDVISSCGFSLLSCNRYYDMSADENRESIISSYNTLLADIQSQGLKVSEFSEKYRPQILELWKKELDSCNFSSDDYEVNIKNAILVTDNDKLCGVYIARCSGNKYGLWHLAVSREYRGRKLAQFLTYAHAKAAVENGYSIIFNWIADDNIPSIKLHEKIGMKHNSNTSYQFILK